MELSAELKKRGFINQFTTETLEEILDGPKRTIYHGIDPSSDSAQVGNMVVWMLLRHLADAGHKIIFLVGGGTGMIGDPKPDAERVLQDESVVRGNVEKIKAQAEKLIGASSGIEFVNNADWLMKESLIGFLRDIGKHFTVNELIKKDAISARLEGESGISYTEFAYPLLQAYDFLMLNRTHGCDVQVGGSDQWGNIVAGVDLVRRKEQKEVYAVTVPIIINRATGKKFGKSEDGAVWLDPVKTSPYDFYQFWLNVPDDGVIDYLKLFTPLSLDEIESIANDFSSDPAGRLAQKRLAYEVTAMVHGKEDADNASRVSDILFGEGNVSDLNSEEIEVLKNNAPTAEANIGDAVVDVLVSSELASSKREARTFIEDGAVVLGVRKIESTDEVVLEEDFSNGISILRRGKKKYCVLVK